MAKTIGEVQAEIEAALSRLGSCILPPELRALEHLAPAGMSARVSLRRAEGNRQIRRTADSSYWQPENCSAVISYEREAGEPADGDAHQTDAELADILVALDEAERSPRFREFVGLKPFRDQFLPGRGCDWAQQQQDRHRVLSAAIQAKLILTGKIPNPKSPENPTTTIRLNRGHRQVEAVLESTRESRSPFHPVRIRGAGLSSTVVSERR